MPEVIRTYLPQELFLLMRAYKLRRSSLVVFNMFTVVMICGVIELYFGFYAFLWNVSCKVAVFNWMQHDLIISIIFVLLLNLYLVLKALPGNLIEKYCIPRLIHPTENPSICNRILLYLLETLGTVVTLMIMVTVLYYMVTLCGTYAFFGLFLASLLFTIAFIVVMPAIIDPLMGKAVELENMSLKADLENLTGRIGFPMKQVIIIRVRDASTGSNAFFYGACCLKRIVIFDTLLYNRGLRDPSQLPVQEQNKGLQNPLVVAVVAHELGHWKCGHFCKTLFVFKLHIFLTLLLFSITVHHAPIYEAVGFEKGLTPIIVGFIVIFGYVLTPYFTISNVLMLSVTRCFEYEADKFAHKLGHGSQLQQALLKLYADNLSFPISDECYSIWNHTHPTMLHRLQRLEDLQHS